MDQALRMLQRLPAAAPKSFAEQLRFAPPAPVDRLAVASKTALSDGQQQIFQELLDTQLEHDTQASTYLLRQRKHVATRTLEIDGRKFFITDTLDSGGFGKFRMGMDEEGHLVAVKVFRLGSSRLDKPNQTRHTSFAAYDAELRRVEGIGGKFRPLCTARIQAAWDDKAYWVLPLYEHNARRIFHAIDINQDVEKHIKLPVAVHMLADLAQDLADVHSKRVVHRDIKPVNIMIDAGGHFVPIDFGLAEQLDQKRGGPAGTMGFLPPEMILDRQPVQLSGDVWSLGVTVLRCLVNLNPFLGNVGSASDSAASIAATEAYVAFEKTLRYTPQGLLVDACLADRTNAFAKAIAYLHAIDPPLAAFVVSRMLAVDPTRRATMDQCAAFARRRLAQLKAPPASQLLQSVLSNNVQQRAWGYALRAHQVAAESGVD